ncbi:type II toxin-antitoxin system prevent-host-death family antitoxin [Eggerthella sinensis]|uniref:type II toxin-antitoxin system prevent-host-death family antitoxin n=1 Tax=Eggerthella sinensis TaxID=242230 RepID=UPI00266C9284|nr:type II toxin-antitoxin system prevent-host-death family antitoxin [Eggerthella sinensis]
MTPASIPASEFRQNFGKYMALVDVQDFQVTKNGKVIGLWTNPHRDKLALVDRLAGSVHATVDLERDRAERRDRL